jgi:ABC-type uncharacterized transport system substrate-binding protein
MMRRRDLITLLGGAAAAWPVAVRAQQSATPVIGYLSNRSPDAEAPLQVPILRALEEAGFIIGRNVAIDYRFAEGRDDRLPMLSAELVRRQVTVLVATDRPSAVAAKAATATIPIVFAVAYDPVKLGLAASLNRPGGNATGMFVFGGELGPKRLGLLREVLPNPGLIAFVINPNSDATPAQISEMQSAAQAIGLPLLVLAAGSEREIDEVFATMAQRKVVAVIFGTTPFYQVVADRLVALAARYAIPAMYEWRDFVTAGGLMSYNSNRNEFGRQIGLYAAQVLQGAKPGDLPVVQSTKFELVINLKTAKALGLEVPPMLLARADEVIE